MIISIYLFCLEQIIRQWVGWNTPSIALLQVSRLAVNRQAQDCDEAGMSKTGKGNHRTLVHSSIQNNCQSKKNVLASNGVQRLACGFTL